MVEVVWSYSETLGLTAFWILSKASDGALSKPNCKALGPNRKGTVCQAASAFGRNPHPYKNTAELCHSFLLPAGKAQPCVPNTKQLQAAAGAYLFRQESSVKRCPGTA